MEKLDYIKESLIEEGIRGLLVDIIEEKYPDDTTNVYHKTIRLNIPRVMDLLKKLFINNPVHLLNLKFKLSGLLGVFHYNAIMSCLMEMFNKPPFRVEGEFIYLDMDFLVLGTSGVLGTSSVLDDEVSKIDVELESVEDTLIQILDKVDELRDSISRLKQNRLELIEFKSQYLIDNKLSSDTVGDSGVPGVVLDDSFGGVFDSK